MKKHISKLRILETTDLHTRILPYDYHSDSPAPGTGLWQIAGLVDEIRREGIPTLLFDNGDFLQGNPLTDHQMSKGLRAAPNPMITAMNEIGYDAVCLGNHEFNSGVETVKAAIAQARFPVLCANATFGRDAIAPAYRIISKTLTSETGQDRSVRIGVFGCVTPQFATWDHEVLKGQVQTTDIVETAQDCVKSLRELGAEVIIALCHSGIGSAEHEHRQENAIIPLARIEGIDAVLAGHTHSAFPDPDFDGDPCPMVDPVSGMIHGTPVVQAGFYGAYVGRIDLSLEWDNAHVRVTSAKVDLIKTPATLSTTQTPAKPTTQIQKHHKQTLAHIRQPIVKTTAAISSHFAMLGFDMSLQLLAEAQRSILLATATDADWRALPVLSAVSPFLAGGRSGPQNYINVTSGEISMRDAAAIYPFANSVYGLEINGKGLRDWLNRASLVFNTIDPELQRQNLLSKNKAPYLFDMIYGLDYQIDLSQSDNRISDLKYQGRNVSDTDRFVVATNSHRAHGGGNLVADNTARIIHQTGQGVRDALVDYLCGFDRVDGQATPPWNFAPMGGARAQFLTAPCADPSSVTNRRIHATGRQHNGFAEFEITL